jgi:hypothetical protein
MPFAPKLALVCALCLSSAALSAWAVGCAGTDTAETPPASPTPEELAIREAEAERLEREAAIARDYPWHGLIRAKLLRVRREPSRDAEVIGWMRRGEKVRVAASPASTEECAGGFYALHPEGYACAPHDVLVGEAPPHANFHLDPPARVDEALPYDYFFVSRQNAPQFFREPTEEEHRATLAYIRRLQHYQDDEPQRLEAFLEGRIRDEPTKPEVVFEVMARGHFIASPHIEHRDGERFVRTVQGRVMLASMLHARRGSSFEGLAITPERPLPIAWANRPAHPLIAEERDDGSVRFVEDEAHPLFERYQLLEDLPRRIRKGEHFVHEVAEDRYLKEWFISVAELVQPTFEVADDEVWFHVNVAEQTLVVYRGRTPVYATLVSTGLRGHDTPRGLFRIERKFVGRTMDHIGPDTGNDGYRIEDVPWTQFFYRSVAVHGAFWHDRFGTQRSHGCINVSPRDARRLYFLSEPEAPEGWYGVHQRREGSSGTKIWITR